jgi:hypothetical protein
VVEAAQVKFDRKLEHFLRRNLHGAVISDALYDHANALSDELFKSPRASRNTLSIGFSIGGIAALSLAGFLLLFGRHLLDINGDGAISLTDAHAAIDLVRYGRLDKIPKQFRHRDHVDTLVTSYSREPGIAMVVDEGMWCCPSKPGPLSDLHSR